MLNLSSDLNFNDDYSIEARSLGLPNWRYIPNIASHNFWVLKDQNDQILAELHGLATERQTGKIMPIGYSEKRHALLVYHPIYEKAGCYRLGSEFCQPIKKPIKNFLSKDGQIKHLVFKGSQKEALARWQAAVCALNYINAKDLNYPAWGVKCRQQTINSNSAYRTLGEIMALPIHIFKGIWQPGVQNLMLSPREINFFKYNHNF